VKKVMAFLFVFALAAIVYAATTGKRTWEYQFVEINTKLDVTRAKLNQMDGEGWEVIGYDSGLFVLKRRYQEP
jgi:hypothetical protein